MRVSDYIVNFLEDRGVRCIFGYPGGNITYMLDAIHKNESLHYVQGYHEQGCAFSAVGYAKVSGQVGVAMSSSGPGAMNMITAIADAYYDSVPCIFFTGQVSIHNDKPTVSVRQSYFQESNIVEMVRTITKYSATVADPTSIEAHLEKAFFYSLEGRKGPVLLDLPHNIQSKKIDIEKSLISSSFSLQQHSDDSVDIASRKITDLLIGAEKPLILIGRGLSNILEEKRVLELSNLMKIPIISTLPGLNSSLTGSKNYFGFIGECGHKSANYALANCDLLLVLGARFSGRNGLNPTNITSKTQVIHVDIDKSELDFYDQSYLKVNFPIELIISKVLLILSDFDSRIPAHNSWMGLVKNNTINKDIDTKGGLNANDFLGNLCPFLKDAIISADVGQNLLWVAQSLALADKISFIASGGLGAMGFSLPASIGGYYAKPNAMHICITGDGGFQMNLQELQTVVKHNLPIKIFVLNNSSLGMIRAYQEKWFGHQLGSVQEYLPILNIKKIASAFGIAYKQINNISKIADIHDMLTNQNPCIFEVLVEEDSQVYTDFPLSLFSEDETA